MKRWTIRIALCLLLGALLNVAVAWACAVWSPMVTPLVVADYAAFHDRPWENGIAPPHGVTEGIPRSWLDWPHGKAPGLVTVRTLGFQGLGVRRIEVIINAIISGQGKRGPDHHRLFWSAGWPFLSLTCALDSNSETGRIAIDTALVDSGEAVTIPKFLRRLARDPSKEWVPGLPLRPLWTGQLRNTGLYSFACFVTVASWVGIRKTMRRRRGLCPHCAYPIGTSPVCTECGRPLQAAERRKSVAQGANPG